MSFNVNIDITNNYHIGIDNIDVINDIILQNMDNIAGNIELVPIGQDSNVTELDRYQHAEPGDRVSQANCKTFNLEKELGKYASY